MKIVAAIFCPPKSVFPTPPLDQSACRLIDCPECKKPMWISVKKKLLLDDFKLINQEVILECYICFAVRVKNDPELLKNHVTVNI